MELCPVDDRPERQFREKLPKELFRKRPELFVAKLLVLTILLAISLGAALLLPWYFQALAVVALGLLYAHMVELQHELLHGHVFTSKRLNAVFGILMGLPMLSSYHGYKATHLRHHRDLGTATNREFFSYKHSKLDSLGGFLSCAFSLHRYLQVAAEMKRAVLGQRSKDAVNAKEARAIRFDYLLMLGVVVAALAASLYFASPLLLLVWVLPVLLVSEATHFLIETPEHYGLNTQDNPNPLSNTRTIERPSALAFWLTNGNSLHTAHHYHHGIPMCNIKKLNALIKDRISPECVDSNYFSFYKKVVGGNYKFKLDETCMSEV